MRRNVHAVRTDRESVPVDGDGETELVEGLGIRRHQFRGFPPSTVVEAFVDVCGAVAEHPVVGGADHDGVAGGRDSVPEPPGRDSIRRLQDRGLRPDAARVLVHEGVFAERARRADHQTVVGDRDAGAEL